MHSCTQQNLFTSSTLNVVYTVWANICIIHEDCTPLTCNAFAADLCGMYKKCVIRVFRGQAA
jgi:hypothetical protein